MGPMAPFARYLIMEKLRPGHDNRARTRHACWALPGAVVAIVLMVLLFAGQFAAGSKEGASVLTRASAEPADAALAASALVPARGD